LVSVQTESVDAIGVLRDVSGENKHVEDGQDDSRFDFLLCPKNHRQTQTDLYHSGRKHDKIHKSGIAGQPARNLRLEFVPLEGEMADSGYHHKYTQCNSKDVLNKVCFHDAAYFVLKPVTQMLLPVNFLTKKPLGILVIELFLLRST